MKLARRKNLITGSAEEIAALAREIHSTVKTPDAGRARLLRSEEDARAALQKFVDDTGEHDVDWINTRTVAEMIERVLAVDMRRAANRKGAVPAALGLVSRIAHHEDALHRAVYLTMDRLVLTSNDEFVFPTKAECSRAVARAFRDAQIADLTAEQVDTIYDRWLEAGPAPTGPVVKGASRTRK